MKILLDTSYLIDLQHGKESFDTANKYFINIIVYAEVLFGFVYMKQNTSRLDKYLEKNSIQILDIDKKIIEKFVKIKVDLRKKGYTIEDFDLLIAATALINSFPLLTKNTKHFIKIPELQLL